MPLPAEVPVAAPTALSGLLCGPVRAAVVRGVFPTAVYLDTSEEVVALVSSDALRLPCALRLATPSSHGLFAAVRPDAVATVGAGEVVVGELRFLVRRWWRPAQPQPLRPGPQLAARADALEELLPVPPADLPADRRDWRPAALVGLGPGLTPTGDDVLAAMLLTLAALPGSAAVVDALARETAPLLAGTTALSATLLRHAAAGRGIPEVTRLVDTLSGSGDLAGPTARLLAVGHSSGAALAHGVLAATRLTADLAVEPPALVA
ncbi:MAG: DUF2877 domain-containing protein [Sporichthyaceae bacterium]